MKASPTLEEAQASEAVYHLASFRSGWPKVLAGIGLLAAVALFATTVGSVAIPITTTFQMIMIKLGLGDWARVWPASYETIFFQIRLPRVILAGLVGGSLAAAGACYQGLFRNPLADPYLIGIASGAGLGATLAILSPFGGAFYGMGLVPLMAFGGAMGAAGLAYLVARVGKTIPTTTLLLAGVAISYFASSITSFLMTISGEQLRVIFSWLLGSFAMSSWRQVIVVLPYLTVGIFIIYLYARPLNVMQLGEEEARQLGIDVERVKLLLVAAASLATGAAVSVSGLIGFVGLVVPHMVRLMVGPDHRVLLPLSVALGGTFLILADLVARTILAPGELPVGIITAFCGAPFFLYLLRQKQRGVY